jgi:hypothetical protein
MTAHTNQVGRAMVEGRTVLRKELVSLPKSGIGGGQSASDQARTSLRPWRHRINVATTTLSQRTTC